MLLKNIPPIKARDDLAGLVVKALRGASINPEIDQYLDNRELAGIILCPSNPFVSIDPIRETFGSS